MTEPDEFVSALKENTKAIRTIEKRFDVFCIQAEDHQKRLDKLDLAVSGNGKLGLKDRISRLEIYAAIIIGLTSTGVVGVTGYVIVKVVELVYTHGMTP